MSTPPEGDYNSRNRSISAELLNNPPDQTERRVNPIDYSGPGHRERVNALCAGAPVTRPKLRAEAVEVRGEPVDMVRPKVPFQPIEQMPAQRCQSSESEKLEMASARSFSVRGTHTTWRIMPLLRHNQNNS